MADSGKNPPYEETQIRCPRLGGTVNFEYCRVERIDRPCARSLVCWAAHFDVEGYFREVLSAEAFDSCFAKEPQSKIASLIELIEQAKKVAQQKPN